MTSQSDRNLAAPPEPEEAGRAHVVSGRQSTVPLMPTNAFAIFAIVFAFLFHPAGIVLGMVARSQIAKTHERGTGMANTGIALGAIFTVFWLIGAIIWLTIVAAGVGASLPR